MEGRENPRRSISLELQYDWVNAGESLLLGSTTERRENAEPSSATDRQREAHLCRRGDCAARYAKLPSHATFPPHFLRGDKFFDRAEWSQRMEGSPPGQTSQTLGLDSHGSWTEAGLFGRTNPRIRRLVKSKAATATGLRVKEIRVQHWLSGGFEGSNVVVTGCFIARCFEISGRGFRSPLCVVSRPLYAFRGPDRYLEGFCSFSQYFAVHDVPRCVRSGCQLDGPLCFACF